MGYGREKCNGNEGKKCCRRENEKKCFCEFSNLEKLIKCFNEAYEEYGEELGNALIFAKKSLQALKAASEANEQSLEIGKNIAGWIAKCGSKYEYNFDDCECVKIAEQLEEILCEINEVLSEAAKKLCDTIEEIADVEDVNDELEEAVQEYVECIQDNNESCQSEEEEEECESEKGYSCKCKGGFKYRKR